MADDPKKQPLTDEEIDTLEGVEEPDVAELQDEEEDDES